MKLSIITPSFNQGRFIERTIQSVLSQDVADLEYWVVDGGSTDETVELLRRYEDRLNWLSEQDNGQTDAVNKGIGVSKGDIIGWLNSDDVYYPGALAAVLAYFSRHPEKQIIYGDADHIDEQDDVIGAYPTEEWNYERLLETCFICQPAVFFRRSLVDRVGALNTKLQYCMDYEYWLRIGKVVELAHLPVKLAGSRLYQDTKTLGSREKVHEEILTMVSDAAGVFSARWAANLGHVVAEERGYRRDTNWQELKFRARVCLTMTQGKLRRGYRLGRQDLYQIREWIAPVLGHWLRGAKKE